ncbi:MAG: hypothetical protein QG589_202 [Patescibacteria group bacterium]|nr:hypothetical protein [Patescibacteria group bacterium]
MQLSQKQKLAVAIIAFSLSGYIIYNTFWSSPAAPAPIVSDSVNNGEVVTDVPQESDILGIASEFDTITFESELFSSPVFQSLTDSNATVSQEPEGRPNPFAEIGVDRVRPAVTSPTTKR